VLRMTRGVIIGALAFLSLAVAVGQRSAAAQDRLLGMAEPVVGKKPYRIAYASIDMNNVFFLGVAYGIASEG
jgi:ABC-type sugar transport system substrate-binding protein